MDIISVIVPIYRVEKYLEQCIDSIIHQTYTALEIILVDDGSDDNSGEICDKYALMDKRIVVIHKENGGQDSARKAGMKIASGKYVAYVDGDDWIEPDMYEVMMGYLHTYDVEIVESGIIDSYGIEEKKRISRFEEGCYKEKEFDTVIGPRLLYSGEFFGHGISPYLFTKIFLRERLVSYQMLAEPSRNIVDDVMCTFPCMCAARSLYITHDCFYHYRIRTNSAKREIRTDIAYIVGKCYNDWINRFDIVKKTDNMEVQINYFTMYLLIAKAISVFDDKLEDTYLTPYGKILRSARVVLYGAGMVGIHMHHYIQSLEKDALVYWADQKYEQIGIEEVGSPEGILKCNYDYVLIAILSENAVRSAKKTLIKLGVPEEKIRWVDSYYIKEPEALLKAAKYQDCKMFDVLKHE